MSFLKTGLSILTPLTSAQTLWGIAIRKQKD